jgi:hypothetical protein
MKNSKKDKKEFKEEPTIIDLPDVKDIPGQENVKPPRLKEFEDTTASSAGEEGDEIWKDNLVDDGDDNVSDSEKELLRKAANYDSEEEDNELKKAIPDTTDQDGDELNEKFSSKDLSAKDLDIPDEFEDDEDEELGKEPGNY